MIKEVLQDAFVNYMETYGKNEADAIIEMVKKSKSFNENIQNCVSGKGIYGSNTINSIAVSSHWKIGIGARRKTYFASLLFLLAVYVKFEELGVYIDEERFTAVFYCISKNH